MSAIPDKSKKADKETLRAKKAVRPLLPQLESLLIRAYFKGMGDGLDRAKTIYSK